MKKAKVIDRRQIRLEEVTSSDYIPFLGGRPERTAIINKDDITNLTILLNTTGSVEEFLEKSAGGT
jgi:hypothetical protein